MEKISAKRQNKSCSITKRKMSLGIFGTADLVCAVTAFALASPIHRAQAAEGSIYGGPIGGSDIRSAYLPPSPGVYLGIVSFPSIGTSLVNNSGGHAVPHFSLYGYVMAGGALAVYPFKLDGGTLASTIQLGAGFDSTQVDEETQNTTGALDIYSDILRWSKFYGTAAMPPDNYSFKRHPLPYGMTLSVAYSMIFPTGRYDTHPTDDIFTQGHNDYFIIPNAAVTYLTTPKYSLWADGTEYSGRLFYDHALENPATHYTSGDVLDLDFAVSERYGHWQVGLAGAAADQLFNDGRHGVKVEPNGKRLVVIKLGPVINYDVPDSSISLKAKLLAPVYVRNSAAVTGLILSATFRLF